ncbi:MAG: beta-xylosidase [Chitinophagaceae bacterium]
MKYLTNLLLFVFIASYTFCQQPISIEVNAAKETGTMKPFWSFFGYDEPNYTYRNDGKKLLTELTQLSPVTVFVRTHNLLTSKGGSPGPDLKWGFTDAYKEDANGNPIYNWLTIDSIVDTYVERGIKPLMEIGFMPKDLTTGPAPYEHSFSKDGTVFTGWTYPPKDFKKWAELVYQWVNHSIKKYGKQEVTSWLWEVWNEPNIGYWKGTFEQYCMLYDYAADAVKRACPECTIGGPHSTGPGWDKAYTFLKNFLTHCLKEKNYATGKIGSPLQFVAFHAKGQPQYMTDHIRMNMGAQLNDIAKGFEIVSSFPQLKNIPVIIGECDPEGCAACSEKMDKRYGYRNGTMYSSYTAASFARIYELMDQYKINLKGAVSWSFEFEDHEWFAGFREMASHGVDKPVLNVFRMLGMMSGKRIEVKTADALKANDIITSGVKTTPDIQALASKDANSIAIMVWNYHDDDLAAAASSVALTINNIGKQKVLVQHYRVDQQFSNSFEKWKQMGKPQNVSAEQYNELEKSGQLQLLESPEWMTITNGKALLNFDLPRQGVSLIRLSW